MEEDATAFCRLYLNPAKYQARHWIYTKEKFIKLFTVYGEETKSIEQGPSWEANSPSASQEISSTFWNPNVH